MTALLAILAGIFGMIWGSFAATMALRWPSGKGVGGRSACDGCGRTLSAFELVPLASFALQRGRCRHCGHAIARIHPAGEVAGALIGVVTFGLLALVPALSVAVMGWLLLPLILSDAKHLLLDEKWMVGTAVVGLVAGGSVAGLPLGDRAIGAVIGLLSLGALMALYRAIRGRDGMGEGDPVMLAAIGAWVGWQGLPPVLLVASGGLLLTLAVTGGLHDNARAHPLGSGLGAGAIIVALLQAMDLLPV